MTGRVVIGMPGQTMSAFRARSHVISSHGEDKAKQICYRSCVDEPRKSAVIAICASILAARKLAAAPRNSPLYVAAIADAVADARRIVERIEQDRTPKRDDSRRGRA